MLRFHGHLGRESVLHNLQCIKDSATVLSYLRGSHLLWHLIVPLFQFISTHVVLKTVSLEYESPYFGSRCANSRCANFACRARRQSIVHNILIMRHFMCCVEQSCTPGKCQAEGVVHRENAVVPALYCDGTILRHALFCDKR